MLWRLPLPPSWGGVHTNPPVSTCAVAPSALAVSCGLTSVYFQMPSRPQRRPGPWNTHSPLLRPSPGSPSNLLSASVALPVLGVSDGWGCPLWPFASGSLHSASWFELVRRAAAVRPSVPPLVGGHCTVGVGPDPTLYLFPLVCSALSQFGSLNWKCVFYRSLWLDPFFWWSILPISAWGLCRVSIYM